MRNFLVAGNWKMHGDAASNRELVAGIVEGAPTAENVSLLVCPPYPYLASVASQLEGTNVALGAQNVSEHEIGAFTGEVAPAMLRDVGCRYAIVGHSERRQVFGETDEDVRARLDAALQLGLDVILCVGETLDERLADRTAEVVLRQVGAGTSGLDGEVLASRVTIAYEPVWAIGTGVVATPDQAQEVHASARGRLARDFGDDVAGRVTIQYGGSVKPGNLAELLAQGDIDGGLVGGASLEPDSFVGLLEAASQLGPRPV